MSDMTAALERIQAACPCGLTTPGMSAEEIEKKLSFFPFRLPRKTVTSYQLPVTRRMVRALVPHQRLPPISGLPPLIWWGPQTQG